MRRTINGKTYSKTIGVKKGEIPVFGDNGELESSGKKPSDIHNELPSGGSAGQILTKTSDGVAWDDIPEELPSIAVGDAGKVLTINQAGTAPVWETPQGGGSLYRHNITITKSGTAILYATLFLPTSEQVTWSNFVSIFGKGTTSSPKTNVLPISGKYISGTSVYSAVGIYVTGDSPLSIHLMYYDLSSTTTSYDEVSAYYSSFTISDTVTLA